jgi:hypothetical protein
MNQSRSFRYKPYNLNKGFNLNQLSNPYENEAKSTKDCVLILSDGVLNGLKALELEQLESITMKTSNASVIDFYKIIESTPCLIGIITFLLI